MSLNENAMAALCKSNIQAISDYPAPGQSPVFVDDRILVALCKGIIDHFKAAGVINSTGTVTSGAGAGGAVIATGAIT